MGEIHGKEPKNKEEPKAQMHGFFEMMRKMHDNSLECAKNLQKLQTNPPNLVRLADCCLACQERYWDDSDYSVSRVFCTKHKQWVNQESKCDDFGRIPAKYENGEGTPEAHQVIRELINQNAW